MADHYRTLGIAPNADEAVIRAVYLALMKRFHPDRDASPEMLKRAQDITAAYAVLSDPKRRAAYDEERAGLDPWARNAALPARRKSGIGGVVLAGLAVATVAGAVALSPMIPIAEPAKRTGSLAASMPGTTHCGSLADSERIRTALIMRLDEVGALDRISAAALTASKFELAAPTDARDLAAPGQVSCLATLAITLPANFSTASGQGSILSELQYSASRTEPESPMRVHPDGRLVAALSGIQHQPSLAAVSNPMLEQQTALVEESSLPAPSFMPDRRQAAKPPTLPRAETPLPRAPVSASTAQIREPARASGLDDIGRQTMNFYGQSLSYANGVKKSRLESSHAGFSKSLSECRNDACKREVYLKRNVEISRIMMGE